MFPRREFKPYRWPGHEHIREFDAKVIAYCDPYVITSPNADWTPEPHCFENEELHARADGRFGYQDCFQWPQAYSERFEYAVCAPNPLKAQELDPSKKLWEFWTPAEEDFELTDPQSPFRVGKLSRDAYYHLYRLYNMSSMSITEWKAKRDGKKDIITGMLAHARHLLNVLKHHPLTFRDVVLYIAQLQHYLLDMAAHMYYVNECQFVLTYPDFPRPTSHLLMGCFTKDVTTCDQLWRTSIPVWLVRSPQFVPQDINIVSVVPVTCPNHIMQKNFLHNGVVTIFPTLHLGPGGTDRHFNTRRIVRAQVTEAPDAIPPDGLPQHGPVASSSQLGTSGGRVQAKKQNNGRNAAQQRVYPSSASRNKVHNLKSGRDKWAELDATNMPLAFPQWVTAFKRVDRNPTRVKSGIVDAGYRFPEPALLITPASPQRRKLFCANWLAARPLWISRIEHNPPNLLPVPQTWRDFLNSIPSDLMADNVMTKSAKEKLAAKMLFGDVLIHLQGETWAGKESVQWRNQTIVIATLEDPPSHLMRSILWEIYELSFRYELLALDRAMVPRLWTEAPEERTQLLHSVFPGESGLVMWEECMPVMEQGMWASAQVAYPFVESWHNLLSSWPQSPSHLQSPIEQASFSSVIQFDILSSACNFYVQCFFDMFGRPPIVSHRVPT